MRPRLATPRSATSPSLISCDRNSTRLPLCANSRPTACEKDDLPTLGRFFALTRSKSAAARPRLQLRQSEIAVGSGGLLGLGPGNSLQKLHYLPSPHADFVCAIIGEDMASSARCFSSAFSGSFCGAASCRPQRARQLRPLSGLGLHRHAGAAGHRAHERRPRPAADHRRAAAAHLARRHC